MHSTFSWPHFKAAHYPALLLPSGFVHAYGIPNFVHQIIHECDVAQFGAVPQVAEFSRLQILSQTPRHNRRITPQSVAIGLTNKRPFRAVVSRADQFEGAAAPDNVRAQACGVISKMQILGERHNDTPAGERHRRHSEGLVRRVEKWRHTFFRGRSGHATNE